MSYLRFSALTKSHHYFVCSCIPLHTFDYTYRYLLYSNVSFIESFVDPGPHGTGRHMEHMLPEIAKEDFRKGAQVKTSFNL
jgi:hypothetical protein